ncbi:MAG TPA: hypothetical protein VET65_05900 [Candidatus Limnocylindrales bacterium]|nr:hypothetical protein [Candidatus Limnocylindrales bacterium]
MAVPRPAPARRVFRPERRVPWGTWILAVVFLLAAVGATGAILLVVQPARVADLGRSESQQLGLARTGAATVQQSLNALWADLGPGGPFALTADKVSADLALAQTTEKQASDALAYDEVAKADLVEADAIPFQLHPPLFTKSDRPAVLHLETGLQAASRLAHAATLELELAQTVAADQGTLDGQLTPALNAHAWTEAARAASTAQGQLKAEQLGAANPDALLDPLWGKWIEARLAYAQTAQSYALNAASGQASTAQQLLQTLSTQSAAIQATGTAARRGAASWAAQTIQPLLDTVSREVGAASLSAG